MTRPRTGSEAAKMKRRRSRSVPCEEPQDEKPTVQKKRARSAAADEEPKRKSKRLKGIAAHVEEEEEGEAEEFVDLKIPTGGWQTDGKERDTRRRFSRTLSGMTTSTAPDEEMSTQSTMPDDDPAAPAAESQSAGMSSQPPPEAPTPSSQTLSVIEDRLIEKLPSPTVSQPPYRNSVPPAVLIDGSPPLRVCYRDTCIYRQRAPIPSLEWRSEQFFLVMLNSNRQEEFEEDLFRDGFIRIPDDLIDIEADDEPAFIHFLADFFERYGHMQRVYPTVADFVNPVTRVLETKRIFWQKKLAEYFCLPDYLNFVFEMIPKHWHVLFHTTPTFSEFRVLSEIIESLGIKRAREKIHQELARRIAFVRGFGKFKPHVYFQYLKMGYEELRAASEKYDHVVGDMFSEERVVDSCSMCFGKPELASELRSYMGWSG